MKRVVVVSAPRSHFEPLRRRADFDEVFRTGERHRAGSLVVLSAEGGTGPPLVGLVVKRVVGTAVERNRIRRRLREALRRAPLRDGVRYVVVASRGTVDVSFDRLVASIRAAVEQKEKT